MKKTLFYLSLAVSVLLPSTSYARPDQLQIGTPQNLLQDSRPQISEGAFKFSHNPAIYYSNGEGHYCWYRSWEDFVQLTNGNTTWRDLSSTLKDYSMVYDGGCGGGGQNTPHPDPDNS